MAITTKQANLRVFRGTFKECMAQETINMKVYLAWDTQEIFIGNKHGAKVKYGGGTSSMEKDINSYINNLKNEIYKSIDKYIENAVDNKVEISLEEFDKKYNEIINNLLKEVNESKEYTDSKITDLENNISDTIRTIAADEVKSLTDGLSETVERHTSEISSINEKIKNIGSTDLSEVNNKINLNASVIEELKTASSEQSTRINGLESRLESSETEIQNIKDDITTINNNINTINSRFNEISIPTKVSQLENDSGFITDSLTEEDVKRIINTNVDLKDFYTKDEINRKFISLSGTEMRRINGTSENIYNIVFCNENGGIYKLGSLYYVANNRFNLMSGGGGTIEKTKVITYLSLSSNDIKKYEISKDVNTVVNISAKSVNNNKGCAVSGNISLIINGAEHSSFTPSEEPSGIKETTITYDIDRDTPQSINVEISAIKKTDDDENEFSLVGNNSSLTFYVYVPTLLGSGEYSDGSEKYHHYENSTGTFSLSHITVGENIYFYSPNRITKITSSGFDYDFSYLGESTILVNNASASYHVYNLNKIYDNSISIEIS